MTPRDLLVNSLIAVMVLAPLAALTVIALRSRRRGWWLAAPWLLLGLIWLMLLQLFQSLDIIGDGKLETAVVGTGFFAGWLTMCIFLVALTVAGPKLPPPGIAGHK